MNEYAGKKVFVSGGAGVIGTALVKQLHSSGAKIFVGDLKPRPKDFPKDIQYRIGDLNEIEKEELQKFDPAIYFHLAATFERSEESYDFWDENYHHNIKLSHHLLDCLKDSSTLQRIVFASSYLIYDPALYLHDAPANKPCRLEEKSAISPRNLCGMAKLLHEEELRFVQSFKQKQLSTVSARIFRSYGRNSRDIISRWIRSLLKGEEITVYAKEGSFDFIFADDVAEGLLKLGKLKDSGTVNLGRGQARKISEVLQILQKHFPKMKAKEEQIKMKFEASEANMDHFQALTGWLPQHRLEDAIPKIIEHEKSLL